MCVCGEGIEGTEKIDPQEDRERASVRVCLWRIQPQSEEKDMSKERKWRNNKIEWLQRIEKKSGNLSGGKDRSTEGKQRNSKCLSAHCVVNIAIGRRKEICRRRESGGIARQSGSREKKKNGNVRDRKD